MLLKDVMSKDVMTLSPNDSLETAARLFVENKISGAPVVDAYHNVVGILTEGDLVRQQKPLTKPVFLMFLDSAFPINYKEINHDLEAMTAIDVSQLMTKDVISLHEYDDISQAADIMIERKINRVPVINDEGQLLGIVTRQDVIRATYLEHKEEASQTQNPSDDSENEQ